MPYSRKRYGSRIKYNKYRRLVKKLKKQGSVKNPYAVARAAIYRKKRK